MFKRIFVIFLNIITIIISLLRFITYNIEKLLYWSIKKIESVKNICFIKKYKVDKHVFNDEIGVSFTLESDDSVTLIIKGNVIKLREDEVDKFLDVFSTLNKKIINNGETKNYSVRE